MSHVIKIYAVCKFSFFSSLVLTELRVNPISDGFRRPKMQTESQKSRLLMPNWQENNMAVHH